MHARYKIRRDDPGDVEGDGEHPRKRIPTKVMWYAPIIPRLKRLFRNKEHAKLSRWLKEDRKVDDMLRHPLMGPSGEQLTENSRSVRDMGKGIRTARIYDYHQAIGPAAVKEEALKG